MTEFTRISDGAAPTEIEITPAMIEAGVRILLRSGFIERGEDPGVISLVVADILRVSNASRQPRA
jgi:hypothetical protein